MEAAGQAVQLLQEVTVDAVKVFPRTRKRAGIEVDFIDRRFARRQEIL